MDQIANLVIDLGIDAAEFKNEIPRIKNLLNGAASDAERSSARMQRFMESDSGRPADNAGGFFGCNSRIRPCADGGEERTGS
ncbi:putative tail length tape measure protein from putative prophage [Escherichia coli]|nr:putative tail length tape measure protein from putative prophage [Escherichia coli]